MSTRAFAKVQRAMKRGRRYKDAKIKIHQSFHLKLKLANNWKWAKNQQLFWKISGPCASNG